MSIETDISGVRLETERLILREWANGDLDDFYEYASVPGVGEAAGWLHHKSREDSKAILDQFIAHKHVFAVVFKETGKVIGSVGIHTSWTDGTNEYGSLNAKEIGYVLSKDYWGRGLMTEAVRAVIDYCKEAMPELDILSVGHISGNDRSRRVIEKCGFVYSDRVIRDDMQAGKGLEEMRYILRLK